MKKAFTLIEVTLAMSILGVGVLSVIGLYSLGYRENRQSREDVEATALADGVLSPLIAAISHTNLAWTTFRDRFVEPSDGWKGYFDDKGIVSQDPESRAENVYSKTMQWLQAGSLTPRVDTGFLPNAGTRNMSCALVVYHEEDSPLVRIGFRATKTPGLLMAMPIFFTEVRFQGDPSR